MPSVNVQFHMMPEELIDFVSEMSSRYSLQVELERWHPKSVHEVPAGADLATEVRDFGQVDRIWLLYRAAESRSTERFMLNVGTMRGKCLDQSQLGAGTNDAEALKLLKKVASDLRRRTHAGVWVISAAGNVGYAKRFRVSKQAANASRIGQVELTNLFRQSVRVDPPE